MVKLRVPGVCTYIFAACRYGVEGARACINSASGSGIGRSPKLRKAKVVGLAMRDNENDLVPCIRHYCIGVCVLVLRKNIDDVASSYNGGDRANSV